MSATPNYASTPKVGSNTIGTADTNRVTPSNSSTIFSAGSSGSRIDRATIQATGTTTQGLVRLFLHDGSNFRLIKEVQVGAVTPSGTIPAWAADITFDGGISLANGWSLRASTHNAEAFCVTAYGADF